MIFSPHQMNWGKQLVAVTTASLSLTLTALQVGAEPCPKDYLRSFDDERYMKISEYWIKDFSDSKTDEAIRSLNAKVLYDQLSNARAPDFRCSFKGSAGPYFFNRISTCTNIAGYKWSPYAGGGGEGFRTGYIIDAKGSYVSSDCHDGTMCTVYVDKSGRNFIVDNDFTATLGVIGVYYRGSNFIVIKDGSSDLQMEAIVLRKFFNAGAKKYVIIGREIESGYYCTYKPMAPNI